MRDGRCMDKCSKRGRASLWDCDGGKMSRIWLFYAIKLVYAIKNPGLEFCAIKAGIQQLSSRGGDSHFWRLDVGRFLVTNLFMSTLLMQTLLYSALWSAVQRQRGYVASNVLKQLKVARGTTYFSFDVFETFETNLWIFFVVCFSSLCLFFSSLMYISL